MEPSRQDEDWRGAWLPLIASGPEIAMNLATLMGNIVWVQELIAPPHLEESETVLNARLLIRLTKGPPLDSRRRKGTSNHSFQFVQCARCSVTEACL
jgi:hypothetical protein